MFNILTDLLIRGNRQPLPIYILLCCKLSHKIVETVPIPFTSSNFEENNIQ